MKSWKLILGLLVVLLVVAGCVPDINQRTINTNGQATIEVQPDLAVVYVAVSTLKDSAEDSKNENSKVTDAIYAALYKIRIDRDDIESQNYNIYEEYDWKEGGRESKGFRTSHTLKITTEEFDDVGEIVDAVIDAGGDDVRINYINFELSDALEKEYKKEALTEASRDAKEKAEAMASGLGARLGDIVSISDSSYSYRPYPLYAEVAEAGMAKEALDEVINTEISPKKLEVRANVQVVYKIR
ncbi:MAG: SIMPL domain-containing protein [Nanoarchaeota archaeon]|nr:SIMPL domain-containing protein [Nanoarchaeota archaeon]